MDLETMLRAAHRAGWIRGRRCSPTFKGAYHRSMWDAEPLRAQLGFGPRAKKDAMLTERKRQDGEGGDAKLSE